MTNYDKFMSIKKEFWLDSDDSIILVWNMGGHVRQGRLQFGYSSAGKSMSTKPCWKGWCRNCHVELSCGSEACEAVHTITHTHTYSSPYFQNWWSSSTRVLLTIFSELVISGFSKSRISVYHFLKYVFVIWSTRYTVSPGIWWFSRLPHLTSNGCIVSTNLLGTRNQWERHQRKKQSVVHVWSHTYG